jgi:alpha-1,3-rhamnosyl/mannosyltransferase
VITVGVDGRPLLGESTGVGRYLRNIIREMVSADPEVKFRLYLDREGEDGLEGLDRIERRRPQGSRGRNILVWTQWDLPKMVRREPVPLVHFPFYTTPLVLGCPSVVTIHDITFSLHPEWFPWRSRISFSAIAPWSARRADRVLTVSEHSRRDLIRKYGLEPDRVTAIPLASDPSFTPRPPGEIEGVTARLGLTPPYLIHLGSIHPRRNLEKLLDAFTDVADRGPDLDLVLAGRVEAPYTEIDSMISRRALEGRVIHLGYAEEVDLPALVSGAEAMVYPSLYEGFGLPVLEAMACGTPVITSNVSALPETAGDAALLVDPGSRESIARAIQSILDEPALRERLKEAGLRRAGSFSWRRTAEATLDAYRSVLSRNQAPGAGSGRSGSR